MLDVGNLAGIFAAYGLVVGAIYAITSKADDALSPDLVKRVSRSLNQAKHTPQSSWIDDFSDMSNALFGPKLFSFRAFGVSTLISVVSCVLVMLCLMLLTDLIGADTGDLTPSLIGDFVALAIGIGFANCITDFVSVVQTRFLIHLRLPLVVKLTLDLLLTFALLPVTFVFFVLIPLIWQAPYLDPLYISYRAYSVVLDVIFGSLTNNIYEDHRGVLVFIYPIIITTFTTSIWIWLHGLVVGLANTSLFSRWVLRYLNTENKPFLAMGYVINILVVLSMLIVIPLHML